MLGVDANAIFSATAKARIEQMETRLTRYYGRFMEMPIEILACAVSNMSDERVFLSPKAPDIPDTPNLTPEEAVAKMSRGLVEIELEKRGFNPTEKHATSYLREVLLKSVKEKEAEKAKESV